MEPYEVIVSAIGALPDSPDEIAAFLEKEGIKGFAADVASCPIASWIKRYGLDVWVYTHRICYGERFYHAYLPPEKVVQFIQNYDEGLYPRLNY